MTLRITFKRTSARLKATPLPWPMPASASFARICTPTTLAPRLGPTRRFITPWIFAFSPTPMPYCSRRGGTRPAGRVGSGLGPSPKTCHCFTGFTRGHRGAGGVGEPGGVSAQAGRAGGVKEWPTGNVSCLFAYRSVLKSFSCKIGS